MNDLCRTISFLKYLLYKKKNKFCHQQENYLCTPNNNNQYTYSMKYII